MALLLWASLCLQGSHLMAGELGLTKSFSACMDTSGGVTSSMLDCIASETRKQDARLNKAYKEAMGQLAPARKKALQDVQRLWLKYRDAQCSFYNDPDGGSIAVVQASDCFLMATATRALELESLTN